MGASIADQRGADAAAGAHTAARGQQYLTISVAGETFALPIGCIKEIIEYRQTTDVPMMPTFMRGVLNLRGHVVPVIDLAVRFGRTTADVTRRSCIVILEVHQELLQYDIGVVVDAVSAVVGIADTQIEPAPSFGAGLRQDFISGMGKLGERIVIILAIDKVLSIEELSSMGGTDAGGDAEVGPRETSL
jgi:purine-binding chemotaxis protein CheW